MLCKTNERFEKGKEKVRKDKNNMFISFYSSLYFVVLQHCDLQ
jgi:hypothetical protein